MFYLSNKPELLYNSPYSGLYVLVLFRINRLKNRPDTIQNLAKSAVHYSEFSMHIWSCIQWLITISRSVMNWVKATEIYLRFARKKSFIFYLFWKKRIFNQNQSRIFVAYHIKLCHPAPRETIVLSEKTGLAQKMGY